MKLNLGRRILLFVYWLASLILLASLVLPDYAGIAFSYAANLIPAAYMQYVIIALLAVYLLLSLSVLCMVFKRNGQKRSERGFITVDSADTGKVRIAVSAIEQMVKQAAHTVDGLADMKIGIDNADDAIAINVNVTMVNGSHVPTVTLNLQRAIRQFVEMNCGVAVRSVSISIQSVTGGENSRKSKRSELKPAVQPVQEWMPQPEPVVIPEPAVPAAEPVVEESVTAYAVSDDTVCEMPAEEPAFADEAPEEPVETAESELNYEEEKEN